MLATLLLNEMEWLPKLYQQHKDWPGLVKWVFVESADRLYAKANPGMVSDKGLSVDGTSDYLFSEVVRQDPTVYKYIPHGFSSDKDPAQGKCESRQRYLDISNRIEPDFIVILDADEFYTFEDQYLISKMLGEMGDTDAFIFNMRHIWRPDYIKNNPLMELEVAGGFWGMSHVRAWRWRQGIRYAKNHNWVEDSSGQPLNKRCKFLGSGREDPMVIHVGYACSLTTRAAKHSYLEERGEGRKGVDDGRKWYIESRRAWETWRLGAPLPRGATVVPFTGRIPECFR